MKASFFSLLTLLVLISSAFGKVGDRCRSSKGVGTCKKTSSCTKGFTVVGACPHDPANVRCCISKECIYVPPVPQISQRGTCIDKDYGSCSGGRFVKGLCPGDNSVQCCIKSSSGIPPPKQPSPPKCPKFKTLKQPGIDDIVFSRAKTSEFQRVFKTVKTGLEICAIIGGVVGEGVGGLPCGVAAIGVDVYVNHAEECEDKNQCFTLKDRLWPACRGGKDCC